MTEQSCAQNAKSKSTRLAAYSTVAASALFGTSDASAGITYIEVNTLLNDTTTNGGGEVLGLGFGVSNSFNLDIGHSIGSSLPSLGYALAGRLNSAAAPGLSLAGFAAAGYNYVSNVTFGVNVSALTQWLPGNEFGTLANQSGYSNSQFLNSGEGFLAIRFDDGNGFSYGWLRLDMSGGGLNSINVIDYAFGAPNESITVGQTSAVPEPSSLALLAMGATGTLAWRRRRQLKHNAATMTN